MPAFNTYIRKDLAKPLKKYCKAKDIRAGTLINEMLTEKLSKEGFY